MFLRSIVAVLGETQSPAACLLNCELQLPSAYLGVPDVHTITLCNQTLLPTTFRWAEVRVATQFIGISLDILL